MLNLWKCSTIAFALQLVTVLVACMLTSDISLVLGSGTAVPFVWVMLPKRSSLLRLTLKNAAFGAFCVMLTFLVYMVAAGFGSFLALCTIYAVAYNARSLAEEAQEEEGAKEAIPLLVIPALPFGIGTILGGVILVYREWEHFLELAGWD